MPASDTPVRPLAAAAPPDAARDAARPAPEDVDVFGLTDVGRVRQTNDDAFFVASLHHALRVHASSVDMGGMPPLETEPRGFVMLVADGVGGLPGGAEASSRAIRAVAEHLLHHGDLPRARSDGGSAAVPESLRQSMLSGHEAVRELARESGRRKAATTLTMVAVVWPRAFVVHAGDSRCYRLRGDALERLTTDQTMAQAMVEAGVLAADQAAASHLSNVLWSALGSSEVDPQVLVIDCDRRDVVLLCSDGLTKHVSEEEIHACLAIDERSEATCRALVDLALERGGTDNVTVVVGRLRGGKPVE